MKEWNYMAIDEKWARPWEKNNSACARDISENYGWDVLRIYEMMRHEITEDWDEGAAEGAYRFCAKVFRMVSATDPTMEQMPAHKEILDDLHVELDEAFFHPRNPGLSLTAAALMKAVKRLHNLEKEHGSTVHHSHVDPLDEQEQSLYGYIDTETSKWLLIFLYPFMPHTASELWEMIGLAGSPTDHSWSAYKPASSHMIEIPVQVNGKVRKHIKVNAGTSEEEVK